MNGEWTRIGLLHGQKQGSSGEESPKDLTQEPAVEQPPPDTEDGLLVVLEGGRRQSSEPTTDGVSGRASGLGLRVAEAFHTEKLYVSKPYVHTKNHPDAFRALSISDRIELIGACTICLTELADEILCKWARELLGPDHPTICRLGLTRLVAQEFENYAPDDRPSKGP
jgi:hypothetical protein